MSFDDMAVFVSVAEHSSVTGAARALGMPKSTVSRRLDALERRLGVALLRRTSRQVSLTEVGATYLVQAKQAVAQAELADRSVLDVREQVRGLLRVAASPYFGDTFLGPELARFLGRHPGLQMEIRLGYEQVDLMRDGIDVAIRAGSPPPSAALIARPLGVSAVVYCASPEYLERRGTPGSPEDLTSHDRLVLGWPKADWSFHPSVGPPFQIAVTGRLAVNSIHIARDAALAGLGIARLPAFAVREDLDAGRLIPVLPGWAPPERTVFALYPRLSRPSPKVRAFVAFLRETFGAALGGERQDRAGPSSR